MLVRSMNMVAFHWCRMMPTLTSHIPVPRPSYTQARENLVKAIPPKILCLLACGGKDCRYEGPECWKANQQVIRGLFSSWWDIVSVNTTTLHQRAAHSLLPHAGSRTTSLPWRGRRVIWSRSTASSNSFWGYLCSSLLGLQASLATV